MLSRPQSQLCEHTMPNMLCMLRVPCFDDFETPIAPATRHYPARRVCFRASGECNLRHALVRSTTTTHNTQTCML